MVTLRKIVYDIRGIIRDAKSDDLHFTDRQIAFWVHSLRAQLLKERLDKKQTISTENYQVLDNIPVSQESSYTGVTVDSDCLILRTSNKIPSIMEDNGNYVLRDLRSPYITSKITLMHKSQAIRVVDNKYTKNMLVAFIENDYIYFLCNGGYFENISITGVFNNPEDVNVAKGLDSLNLDGLYPIDNSLLETIKRLILTVNLSLYIKLPADRDNDAQTAY